GDERFFVAEQRGKVRFIDASGNVPAADFLDIEDRVKFNNSEEGLLGIAFHPNYAENGLFYVNYIFDPGPGLDRTRVSRFSVSAADPDLADPNSELVLLEFEQDFSNHNGGDLKFGPDGFLYVASGDGGSGGDPNDRAQATNTLMGKILRIDVDTPPGAGNGPDCTLAPGANYSIPPSNAFSDGAGGGCDEIYALGMRNPWRISFDRETGDLWIGDVGQNDIEEIDFALAGSGGGLNYGWRCFEGTQEFDLRECNGSYLDPVFEYPHVQGNCSVTGGFVYRGQDFPAIQGQYFFSDFCNSSIRSLAGPVNDLVETEVLPAGVVLFTTFGEDERGELFGADFLSGTIFQITAEAVANMPGDVDGDGDIDRLDLREIFLAVGTAADGPDDPRDVDGNGFITRRDVFEAFQSCTRPMCATE
ncbi:MAG: PQQ-dependent sugar dehydrogenase, partial [Pseudomonadota bacterium]